MIDRQNCKDLLFQVLDNNNQFLRTGCQEREYSFEEVFFYFYFYFLGLRTDR